MGNYNSQGRDGTTSTNLPRKPDPVYECGFDPNGKKLLVCFSHWTKCEDSGCVSRLARHKALGKYLGAKYGDGLLPPDHR